MFRRRRPVDDFAAEIAAHLQLEIDRLRAEGLSPDEATTAARRAFGSVTLSTERFYESHRWYVWDQLTQDLRHAVRTLRAAPAFAAAAILTIAVGIGATTAIFSVVEATLLRPLPYPDPDRLVSVVDDLPGVGSRDVGLSQPEWLDLERSGIFERISPAWYDENNLTGAASPTTVRLTIVAPNYFALLGVTPQLGRTFPADDRRPGFTGDAVISDGMWARGFGRDPQVLGQRIRLDRVHPGPGHLLGDGQRDRAGPGAQVGDYRLGHVHAGQRVDRPAGQDLGLRPRHKHARAHGQVQIAEIGVPGNVLQRLPGLAPGDLVPEPGIERGVGHHRQAAPRHPVHVRGNQLGVGPR